MLKIMYTDLLCTYPLNNNEQITLWVLVWDFSKASRNGAVRKRIKDNAL